MKIKSTIFLLFSALFLWGCAEKIVMESEERERIVVAECVIDSEKKVQTVNLYYSAYVSEAECPKVEEAEVKITFPDFVNVSPRNHLRIMERYADDVS